MLFSMRDLDSIEALKYDERSTPSYELMKDCVIWDDERPANITPDGYQTLCNLWIARSYLHRGGGFLKKLESEASIRNCWETAVRTKLKWPGLHPDRSSTGYAEIYRVESQRADDF